MAQQVIAVTGGNRGIGLEICRQLAEQAPKARVYLTARSAQDGRRAVQELRAEGFQNVASHPLDVTDPASIAGWVEHLQTEDGGLDVLINNAGVASTGSSISRQIATNTLSVNFFGAQALTEACLPLLRSPGRIVNVSSGMGELSDRYSPELRERLLDPELSKQGLEALMEQFIEACGAGDYQERGWPASTYQVSKAGLNGLTRLWHRLWSEQKGLYIASVCPGWVRTDMGGPSAPRDAAKGAETPVWLALAPLSELGSSGRFFRDMQEIPY